MTTTSLLVKIIIIYFSINIMFYAGGLRATTLPLFNDIIGTNNDTASITDPNLRFELSSDITGVRPDVDEQTSPGSVGISFIDALRSVRNFINFFAVMIFGIPILFFIMPAPIQLFIGAPLGLLAVIGLIFFVRSGQ